MAQIESNPTDNEMFSTGSPNYDGGAYSHQVNGTQLTVYISSMDTAPFVPLSNVTYTVRVYDENGEGPLFTESSTIQANNVGNPGDTSVAVNGLDFSTDYQFNVTVTADRV